MSVFSACMLLDLLNRDHDLPWFKVALYRIASLLDPKLCIRRYIVSIVSRATKAGGNGFSVL